MVEQSFVEPSALSAQRSVFKRVLVRGPNWIGDAVMCEPAIAALRRLFPHAELTLLVKPAVAELFTGHPAVSQILVYEDPRRIDKAGHLIWPDGQNRGRGTGETDHGQYDRVEETAWPDGCAAMYRKDMLDLIGGFDEDFFAYADDAELGLRARLAGWRCLYIPTAVVYHHLGSTLGRYSAERLVLIEDNGNRSRLDFTNVNTNTGLKDRFFILTPPKGTVVIEAPGVKP